MDLYEGNKHNSSIHQFATKKSNLQNMCNLIKHCS